MTTNPFLLTDFYKISHPFQYPKGTTLVYSNLTPRKSRLQGVNKMTFFGLQYFIKEYLIEYFNKNFFEQPKEQLLKDYKRRVVTSLGNDLPTYEHIEKLHDLGYLPIEIKALPEGVAVKMKVPVLTVVNTLPEYFWLTNFIESLMSAILWQPCTSATIAKEYKKILNNFAKKTGMSNEFIQWQGHDFSFRGMSSLESATLSGMGHLLSFTGTDTIPSIDALEKYYNADADKELIGGSVPATEHAIMCSGSKDGEIETFKRLITEIYPTGVISIVSDTWDLWKVCTEYLTELKDIVLSRDGKVVIRPDSGNPVDIICGLNIKKYDNWQNALHEKVSIFEYQNNYYKANLNSVQEYIDEFGNEHHNFDCGLDSFAEITTINTNEHKGVVELLWNIFGGTLTETGHKLLDSHIGAIYGDSITRERATEICQRLMDKGFASQVVFGIGSYTYQYNTRDTFGIAMKATYIEIGDEKREIFKNPITDDGTKISATGLLCVIKEDNEYKLVDKVTWKEEQESELKTVFKNGKLIKDWTLTEIRNNCKC